MSDEQKMKNSIARIDSVVGTLLMNQVVILNVLGVMLNEMNMTEGCDKTRAVADASYQVVSELYPHKMGNEPRH